MAALTALCRGDAALADLIRAVAATRSDATLTSYHRTPRSLTIGQ